ncbi:MULTISPECIES: ABC transporter permease [Roseobacteraceae]|uniref:L-arabinose transporter permease protein n=1 Tax=Pseudosulfitobacter pseudonitzschiae TaxID=1402135 RepID=A0A221K899_9RHOB|nr:MULTISPECIES: ABC transporter permease [Roseobacteraceae]ASM75241.1 L-arabinose transporter permease protein [Pseudosulfitobacter pseudonitzschiae]
MELDFQTTAVLTGWLAATIRLAGPLLLAALGELFAERSGVLNIGIEGVMLLGALAAYLATWVFGSPWIGVLAGMASGLASGLFLGFMYVTVQASHVVVGIIFNIFALGLASYVYRLALSGVSGVQTVTMFTAAKVPYLSDIPILGQVLFSHTLPLYLTVLMVFVAAFTLYRTAFGLNLRAVGENPRAADTAGINVTRYRYGAVIISTVASGAAGAYLVLANVGQFRETIISGQGFIALAIVIFGRWNPWLAALAALVFGAADALQLTLQLMNTGVPPQLLLALPYLLTIIAMSGLIGKANQPDAFMQPYRKE